ncbi:unnamed protein product [Linum tenue]|uniref:60S ribosomal protein L18a-like protein n=1 Tax=Linum tenue TaxID=586396 RepID=A0AAV0M3H0_9ROSI|nr:unnamed protein product [Linum tenue]
MSGEKTKRSSGFGMQIDQQQSFQGVSVVTEPYAAASHHHPHPHPHQLPVTGHHVVVQRGSSALPCCGIGLGWFLFILGFILGAIPWYAGACVFLCAKYDSRERIGLIACSVLVSLCFIRFLFSNL